MGLAKANSNGRMTDSHFGHKDIKSIINVPLFMAST